MLLKFYVNQSNETIRFISLELAVIIESKAKDQLVNNCKEILKILKGLKFQKKSKLFLQLQPVSSNHNIIRMRLIG